MLSVNVGVKQEKSGSVCVFVRSGFVPEGEVTDVISRIFQQSNCIYIKFLANIMSSVRVLCVSSVTVIMLCLQTWRTVHHCMGKQPKWGSLMINK